MTAYTNTYDLTNLAQIETINFFKGNYSFLSSADRVTVYDNSDNISTFAAVPAAGGGTYPDDVRFQDLSAPSFEVGSADSVRLVFETSQQGGPINNTDTVTVEYLDSDGNVVGTKTLYTVHAGNTWGGRLAGAGQTDDYLLLTDDPSHMPGSTANVYIFGDAVAQSGNYVVSDESWKVSNFTTSGGYVDGTMGDDVIDASYAGDPDGDFVDSDDAVLNGATGDDDYIRAGAGNDTVFAGDGDDVILGDGHMTFEATDPNAMVWTPGDSVPFSYATGGDLGDGVPGGTEHIASANSADLSDLSIFLPDGDWDVNAGDTIGFSFTDENGQIITVQSATVQQTAFAQGTDDTGVLTAQGVDQFGNEVALLLQFSENNGSPAQPILAGEQFFDNDADPDAFNGTDITLSEANMTSAYEGSGDDVLSSGAGSDVIDGGAGNDTIDGGLDDDTMTGGTGNDIFVETAGDGADIVTDFGTGDTGSIDDDDQTNNDFVDLSGFYTKDNRQAIEALGGDDFINNIDMLRQDAADGKLDGIINGNDYSAFISGLDLILENGGVAVTGDDLTYDNTNVLCFARGVRIVTAGGEIAVENLEVGDRVVTRDHGYQEIRWIGSTTCRAEGKLAPILFRKGSIGNTADLAVSPNHRMLAQGSTVELVSGDSEALIPAKFMVNGEDIVRVEGGVVEYFHILFDHHELICSEGCWSESFHPGEMGWSAMCEDTRREILALFPTLSVRFTNGYEATARQVLDRRQAITVLAIGA